MRRTLLALSIGITALTGAADILPEMNKHLEFGHECMRRGYEGGAIASANLILLGQIKIYVDDRGATDETKLALADAEFIWEDALDSETKFVRVTSRKEAEIVISFSRDLNVGGQEAGGYTEWSRNVKWQGSEYVGSLKADMKLRTIRPDGKPMTREQARHAALHELGHVLGLDDSVNRGEVMAPLNLRKPIATPSYKEVCVIREIRVKASEMRATALITRWL